MGDLEEEDGRCWGGEMADIGGGLRWLTPREEGSCQKSQFQDCGFSDFCSADSNFWISDFLFFFFFFSQCGKLN